jgi:hypothetical protein
LVTAGIAQPLDHGHIDINHLVLVRRGAPGRLDAPGREQIFRAPWNAVQRSAILARCDLGIGIRRLLDREIFRFRLTLFSAICSSASLKSTPNRLSAAVEPEAVDARRDRRLLRQCRGGRARGKKGRKEASSIHGGRRVPRPLSN